MNDLSKPDRSTVMRNVVILILAGLLAAAIAFVVRAQMTQHWESVARVAFVEDTRFDYVEAERDRLVGYVEERAVELRSTDDIERIVFDRPNRETFIDVEVTGTSATVVSDVANELADLIVAADQDVRAEVIQIELAARTAQLEGIASELAALQAEIADQAEREAFAEANRFANGPEQTEELTVELRQAQDELFLATRYRNAWLEREIETAAEIAELDVQLDVVRSETRVVRPALAAEEPVGPSPATTAFFAGVSVVALGALLLALLSPDDT